MSSIKDLPGAGHEFRVSVGAGNFTKKFNSATRVGNLRNLADNKSTILKVIKKNESSIRMGKFNRLRQLSAWNAVRKEEGNKLTKDDKIKIKSLLKHLGSRQEGEEKVGINHSLAQMQIDRDESFEKERITNIKTKISRYDRAGRTGGEAKMNFAGQPSDSNNETLSMSGRLLQRRFQSKEKMVENKLPSHRIDIHKEPMITDKGDDIPLPPFQNL